jgi:predicted CoA-binding protein
MNADKDAHTDSEIRKFYELKNIAVVGMSKNEEKPGFEREYTHYRVRFRNDN